MSSGGNHFYHNQNCNPRLTRGHVPPPPGFPPLPTRHQNSPHIQLPSPNIFYSNQNSGLNPSNIFSGPRPQVRSQPGPGMRILPAVPASTHQCIIPGQNMHYRGHFVHTIYPTPSNAIPCVSTSPALPSVRCSYNR